MHVSATELNQRSGYLLDQAAKDPIVIEKLGRPFVVMLSVQWYEELEDAYWSALAREVERTAKPEDWLSHEESMAFLKEGLALDV